MLLSSSAAAWCFGRLDPEGVLSSVPTVMTAWLGLFFGNVLVHHKQHGWSLAGLSACPRLCWKKLSRCRWYCNDITQGMALFCELCIRSATVAATAVSSSAVPLTLHLHTPRITAPKSPAS